MSEDHQEAQNKELKSRKKQKRPLWILLLAALAAVAVLLYIFWWPVKADQAYDFTLKTRETVLRIENGTTGSVALDYSLVPKSSLLKARAARSLRNTPLVWSSSDPAVATVDEKGVVTAVDQGAAVITGRFGDLSVSSQVVVFYPLTGIHLNETELTLKKFDRKVLTLSPVPEQALMPTGYSCSSLDESIASIDKNGIVKANAPGETDILFKAGDFETRCHVKVVSPLARIQTEPAILSLNVGENKTLELIVYPADTTDDVSVIWESSDPKVTEVDENGNVRALAPGEARITARTQDRQTETLVEVFAPLQEISLKEEIVRLMKGESQALTVLYTPENTTDDRTAMFTSSDPEAVSVDENGTVTAVGAGGAVITARVGEKEASCEVLVRVPMTGIEISGPNRTVNRGESLTLSVDFYPADTNDDKTIRWESDNPSIVSVEDGALKALTAGETLVTAYCGDFSSKIRITVIVPVNGLEINRTSLSLSKGESASLSAALLPADTTEGGRISFSSSDPSIAKVDGSGNVTAVGGGSCRITASYGGFSASCSVQVLAPLEGISLDQTDVTLIEGKSTKLTVSYIPWDTTDERRVSWSSSDPSVAAVESDGTVRTLAPGTAEVTAKVGEKSATAIIRVKAYVPVQSLTLSEGSISFTSREESCKLTATVAPGDATYPSVSWTSSNTSVASVSADGTVKPVGDGTATITATADGVSASCEVGVTLPKAAEPPKIIVIDAGHGVYWSGAVANGVEEKELTMKTAQACRDYLLEHYANIQVYLTRNGDQPNYTPDHNVRQDIQNRANWAASKGADIVACLHYNAAGGNSRGAMVFYSHNANVTAASKKLAESILKEIVGLGFQNKGVKTSAYGDNDAFGKPDEDYFSIIRNSAYNGIPAVLVEHCFMDNAQDFAMLNPYSLGAADAIGIAKYLGLQEK